MQFTKKIAAIVCLLSLVFALSCASAEVLEVKIWDNVQLPGLQAIADLWTEQSGIDVNIQVVTWDEYWTLLEAGATGGSLPDVFWMHSNQFFKYVSAGTLLDLTDLGLDYTPYPAGITALYNFEGKQYAVPKDYDTIALAYNKELFDAAGLAYPDELSLIHI